MNFKNKSVLYAIIIAVICIMIALSTRFFINRNYSGQIPSMPEGLSSPVKEQLEPAVKKAMNHPRSENLGKLGMIYHANACYKEAAACYELAIKRKKSAWNWNYYLGFLNREMGQSEEAIENFRKVVRKDPKVYHAWYYIGEEENNLGNFKEAESAFNSISRQVTARSSKKSTLRADYFPLFVYADYQKARMVSANNQPDTAKKLLQDLIKNYKSFGPAYRVLGNLYNTEGNSDLGRKYTIRANDLAIYTPPVDTMIDKLSMMSRSDLYLLKKIDEAENGVYPEWAMQLIVNGFRYMPDNKYLLSKFVKLYLVMNIGKEASPLLQKHMAMFHDDFNEISSTAYLLYAKGLYKPALDYYRLARNIRPGDMTLQTSVILCIWHTANKKSAMDSTLNWIAMYPSDSKVLSEGTGLLLNMKEKELAATYFLRLKKLTPQDFNLMLLSAKMAETEGKTGDAERWYFAAFKENPADLKNTANLVNLLMKQEKWEKCISCLKDALDHNPNEPFLLERLGTLLISCPDDKLRNVREGKEYSERAYIHTRSESSILVSAGRSLAVANAMLGDRKNAYSVMQMTISLAKRERMPQSTINDLQRLLTSLR